MYRLTDDIARARRLYPRPLATLPDLLLIDIPALFASRSLPLSRFYPVILETDEERQEFDDFLSAPRAGPISPDLLDRRPSHLSAERIVFAAYPAPTSPWPHVLLCHWPPGYTMLSSDPTHFARGAYTIEVFDIEARIYETAEHLVEVLSRRGAVDISIIRPQSGVSGSA